MDFASALQAQLEAIPEPTVHQRNILGMLRDPDSPRKRRRVHRMEVASRSRLGILPDEEIDWAQGTFPWAQVLQIVLEALIKLLPFILAH